MLRCRRARDTKPERQGCENNDDPERPDRIVTGGDDPGQRDDGPDGEKLVSIGARLINLAEKCEQSADGENASERCWCADERGHDTGCGGCQYGRGHHGEAVDLAERGPVGREPQDERKPDQGTRHKQGNERQPSGLVGARWGGGICCEVIGHHRHLLWSIGNSMRLTCSCA